MRSEIGRGVRVGGDRWGVDMCLEKVRCVVSSGEDMRCVEFGRIRSLLNSLCAVYSALRLTFLCLLFTSYVTGGMYIWGLECVMWMSVWIESIDSPSWLVWA